MVAARATSLLATSVCELPSTPKHPVPHEVLAGMRLAAHDKEAIRVNIYGLPLEPASLGLSRWRVHSCAEGCLHAQARWCPLPI